MSGVRIFGLAAGVTDKQLKVYFSNPRNGGGQVEKIFYPLPHNSAVVIFGDKQVARDLVKREHQISGSEVEVSLLPRSIYRRVVTEVQKDVSDFLNVNPQLVDELQFIGEVNVNFNYDKERYFLDGTWYQLEWALHYVDTMLEAFEFESKEPSNYSRPPRSAQPPRRQQISRPNIPLVKSHETAPASLPPMPGTQMSNLQKFMPQQSMQSKRPNKNKNVMPVGASDAGDQESMQRKMFGNTVRSNLDESGQSRGERDEKSYDGNEEWKSYESAGYRSRGTEDSDSENEALLAAEYDRKVARTAGNLGQKPKPIRPLPAVPQMTKGIDVAQTDFGEVPLTFSFELPGDLHIHIAFADITKQTTDAIVNPTTTELTNVFGVSRAITAAAGPDMQEACDRYLEENGPLHCADVMSTPAGGKLSPKLASVLHTVGPHWREKDSEESTHYLVCTYINCFQFADQKLWVKSIATPLISAGAFGFPLDVCTGAFYDAILLFATRSTSSRHLREIHLVCFDKESAMATIMIIQSLMDCDKSQAAVSATDRYWMRSQKFNFQAKYFVSSCDQEDAENSSSSDDEAGDHGKLNLSNKNDRKFQTGDSDRRDGDGADEDTDEDNDADTNSFARGNILHPLEDERSVTATVQKVYKTEGIKRRDDNVADEDSDEENNADGNVFAGGKKLRILDTGRSLMATVEKVSLETKPKPIVNKVDDDDDDDGEDDDDDDNFAKYKVDKEKIEKEPPYVRVPEGVRETESGEESPAEESPERVLSNKIDLSDEENANNDDLALDNTEVSETKETFERHTAVEVGPDQLTNDVLHEARDEEAECSEDDKEEMMPVFSDYDEQMQLQEKVSLRDIKSSTVPRNDVEKRTSGDDVKVVTDVSKEDDVKEKENPDDKEEEEGLFL